MWALPEEENDVLLALPPALFLLTPSNVDVVAPCIFTHLRNHDLPTVDGTSESSTLKML